MPAVIPINMEIIEKPGMDLVTSMVIGAAHSDSSWTQVPPDDSHTCASSSSVPEESGAVSVYWELPVLVPPTVY